MLGGEVGYVVDGVEIGARLGDSVVIAWDLCPDAICLASRLVSFDEESLLCAELIKH